jgi:voltage-gated potassium channel
MNLFRQLKLAVAIILGLLIFGSVGYMIVERVDLLDALYITVSTLTTLGIVEPLSHAGKIFTIFFALVGVSIVFTVVFWAVGNAVELAASERMQKLIWRKRMDKTIRSLKGHYIICGYGRMGQAIASEFRARKVRFVVIENNPEQIPRLQLENELYIEGDASDEDVLKSAGIENAKGLISVAPSDADNTFIVLTAKGMNPKLFVVARSIKAEDESKLRRAGADRVMSPYILGGKRMAWAVLCPNVIDFLDTAVNFDSLEMEIVEVTVSSESRFAGKTIRDSGVREQSGATVIALKNTSGTLVSSPTPDIQICDGDILIAVGTPNQVEELQRMAQS